VIIIKYILLNDAHAKMNFAYITDFFKRKLSTFYRLINLNLNS